MIRRVAREGVGVERRPAKPVEAGPPPAVFSARYTLRAREARGPTGSVMAVRKTGCSSCVLKSPTLNLLACHGKTLGGDLATDMNTVQ
ncbi:hypothetical protein BV25DRAFT_1322610 [Artomyces pyxidatus]|uniref:Uncharacterized protein n=1 Tax=Artomyces pyxidatus TaxID=48021 RepID=A0ACB8SN99_9AGAM|nr:hypothetical protein BV25DRAFT_1322610 [Artomyces pyxidatus]